HRLVLNSRRRVFPATHSFLRCARLWSRVTCDRPASRTACEWSVRVDRKRSSPGRTLVSDYTLPDLDWDYGALEPHISGAINELHHDKHHATYVKGANDA